jgi:hypothetical protein|tara:strand:+ start:5265 stop:5753 length:489 start_codon:yes stop_codon:yes gene_type:complete
MAILDPNEIFFTAFEPKQQNRFLMLVDGVPSYFIKGVGAISLTQGEVVLNHINVYRKVKGKTTWGDVQLTLHDPVSPSGTQTIMEWVRLHHESVTGRDGYSDFYKKDVTLNILGPVGDIVSEWVLKGCFIKDANFGEYSWDNADAAQTITMTLAPDYCVLNY